MTPSPKNATLAIRFPLLPIVQRALRDCAAWAKTCEDLRDAAEAES
jgi:hypothetical protein